MKKIWVMMLATLMVSFTMMAGNVKKSTTLPIGGEIVKASHPMIQYVGRVSFAKNPDVASFNYLLPLHPETSLNELVNGC